MEGNPKKKKNGKYTALRMLFITKDKRIGNSILCMFLVRFPKYPQEMPVESLKKLFKNLKK